MSAPRIDSYRIFVSLLYLEKWARKTEIHFKFITVNLSLISWFTLDKVLLTIQYDVCTTKRLPWKRAMLYCTLRNVHSCKAIFWKYSGTMYTDYRLVMWALSFVADGLMAVISIFSTIFWIAVIKKSEECKVQLCYVSFLHAKQST